VVSPDGCLLERTVHPLDLAVCRGVLGFGQAMFDTVSLASAIEGIAAPSGGGAIAVLGQVGELDAVIGQYGVDLLRYGRRQFVEEVPGRSTRGVLHQPDEGVLGGPVRRHEEIELAFFGADLGDVDVEVAA
jgi:hypothetical protein